MKEMRKDTPSREWIRNWKKFHGEFGGWSGPATIQAVTPRAIEFYQNGASAKVAGMATAKEYQLFSQNARNGEDAAGSRKERNELTRAILSAESLEMLKEETHKKFWVKDL